MGWVRAGCVVAGHALVAASVLPAGGATPAPARDDRVAAALRVLHAWDARRAAAWEQQDARALRSLYLPGSRAGVRDAGLLGAYTARHLVVRRLETQVFAVTVVRSRPARLVLRVHDRVAGGVVDDGVATTPLPPSAPAVRMVELRRAGSWRVAEVRAVSGSG